MYIYFIFYCQSLYLCKSFMAFKRLVIFLRLVALNHIHIWYFRNVCTGPTYPISCLPTTTPPHNLNFPQPFVIFIISYIFTSLNQSYPCYCSETCTEPTNSIFFIFHVAPGLCHLDYSFSVCKISHKLNFCFIYIFFVNSSLAALISCLIILKHYCTIKYIVNQIKNVNK